MSVRLAALALLLGLAAALTACLTAATGSSFQDPRRFHPRPGQRSAVEPIAKVNDRLYGTYFLGIWGAAIEPPSLREKYLADPEARISNWQIVTGTGQTLILDYIFTTPYGEVVFDVVEVE